MHDGKLLIEGRHLLDLPTGQWVHFEVSAALGTRSVGTWDLTVTLPGQQTKRFADLKNRNADFKALKWLGFSSIATKKTVFYLDNLEIKNDK